MLAVVARAVRVGLLFVLLGVVVTLFNVWWSGILDVYPLLLGVYAMTAVSVFPYALINAVSAVRNRHDSRWPVTFGLSITLMLSLSAALVRLGQLRSIVLPFLVPQLRFDSVLALSLALLGLSTLIYMGSVIPEGRRLIRSVVMSFREQDEDRESVEVI